MTGLETQSVCYNGTACYVVINCTYSSASWYIVLILKNLYKIITSTPIASDIKNFFENSFSCLLGRCADSHLISWPVMHLYKYSFIWRLVIGIAEIGTCGIRNGGIQLCSCDGSRVAVAVQENMVTSITREISSASRFSLRERRGRSWEVPGTSDRSRSPVCWGGLSIFISLLPDSSCHQQRCNYHPPNSKRDGKY